MKAIKRYLDKTKQDNNKKNKNTDGRKKATWKGTLKYFITSLVVVHSDKKEKQRTCLLPFKCP